LSALEAQGSQILFNERLFDEILMNEGIITHYLPLKISQGKKQEKGIDVWLALEAYELAVYKRYDVLVLIACDGDYVPLVRKLSTLGTRVMLLSWDFQYNDEFGSLQSTRTSQDLLEEVTYPIAMHELIDNRVRQNDSIINNLFGFAPPIRIAGPSSRPISSNAGKSAPGPDNGIGNTGLEIKTSRIKTLENGYGFIEYPPNNVFFHYSQLVNVDFNDLKIGDNVEFTLTDRDGKPNAINVRKAGV
jgi:cold shock CspA family protein